MRSAKARFQVLKSDRKHGLGKLTVEEIKLRRRVVCICKAIPMARILDAIREKGCQSVDEVNRATGCGRGDCGGQRCRPVIEETLERAQASSKEPAST